MNAGEKSETPRRAADEQPPCLSKSRRNVGKARVMCWNCGRPWTFG